MAKGGKGKKAPNGSGSVWLRPDGRWGAALSYPYYDPETARTKAKRVSTTKKTWEAAHRWLMQKQNDLLGGVPDAPQNPPLGEYLDEWLRNVVEPSVAPKTHEKREYHVRVHISPALGHIRLKDLQARQIHTLYVRMARMESEGRAPLAASTRLDIHTTLKMALKQAVRWGLMSQNPAEFVDPPKPTEVDGEEEGERRSGRSPTSRPASSSRRRRGSAGTITMSLRSALASGPASSWASGGGTSTSGLTRHP